MSIGATLPIVLCAGEAASTIRAMEREIQQCHSEISRYSTGYEHDIRELNMQLTSGNRRFYSAEKIQQMETKLKDNQDALTRTRAPLEARIAELRAKITTVPAETRTGTMQGLMATTANPPLAQFPPGIVPLIASFLAS